MQDARSHRVVVTRMLRILMVMSAPYNSCIYNIRRVEPVCRRRSSTTAALRGHQSERPRPFRDHTHISGVSYPAATLNYHLVTRPASMKKANRMTANLPYQNPALPASQRIADLLGRMTLEEKVGQMMQLDARNGDLDDLIVAKHVGSILHTSPADLPR